MKIPFVTDSYRGSIPINWYPVKDDEKGVILKGRPGLSEFADIGSTVPVRAFYKDAPNNILYILAGGKAYKMTAAGVITEIGDVSTSTGPGWIVGNGPQIMFVDGVNGYTYTIATGVYAEIADVDFPGASCCTYQDGYGVILAPSTGTFYISALYDFTAWDALDYASAEGWPDNLVAALMDHRELLLFGQITIENWINTGAADFPFERREGAFIETGLGAAGSPAKLDNNVYFLTDQYQIARLVGYQVQIISTSKIANEISALTSKNDALGMGLVYDGLPFYLLSFPTGGITYCYDVSLSLRVNTHIWHKWASYPGTGRFRGNCYAHFAGYHLFGDNSNGKIYYLNPDDYQDNGEHLIAEMESQEISQEGAWVHYPSMQIEFDAGHAAQGEDPQAMLSWSDDSGFTWSNEHWVSIGKTGEYGRRAIWRRLGSGFRRRYRLRVTHNVNRNILSVNWLK